MEYGGFKQLQVVVVNSIFDSEPSSEKSQSILMDRTGMSFYVMNSLLQLHKQAVIETFGLINGVIKDNAKLGIPESDATRVELSRTVENTIVAFFSIIDKSPSVYTEIVRMKIQLNSSPNQIHPVLANVASELMINTRGYFYKLEDIPDRQAGCIISLEGTLSAFWELKCKHISNSVTKVNGFVIDKIFLESPERKISITDRNDIEVSLMQATYSVATSFRNCTKMRN